MKKKWFKIVAATLCMLLVLPTLCACASDARKLAEQEDFKNFMNEMFVAQLEGDTLSTHYVLKNPTAYGISNAEAKLFDATEEEPTVDERKTAINLLISSLKSFKKSYLTQQQQNSLEVTTAYYTLMLEACDFQDYQTPFDYISGVQGNLPINFAEYKFYINNDVTDYLSLLQQVPAYLDYCVAYENERIEKGFGLSDIALDKAIGQCNDFLSATTNNYLIGTFDTRIDAVDFFTEAEKATYKAENSTIILNTILPAYQKLANDLSAMKGKGIANGIYGYPNGAEYYKHLVRDNTGATRNINDIIDLLNNEVRSNLNSFTLYATSIDPQGYYQYATGFQPYTTKPNLILDYLKGSISSKFPDIVESTYSINYVHPALEASLSPAFYMVPPIDAYTENVIYINNGSVDNASLFTTLAHEGYPGHLYQNVYFNSVNEIPWRRLMNFNGYSEGWATYVELLSYSLYPAAADLAEQYKNFGFLQTKLSLSVSCSIDIGVNYEGWTVTDVAQYLSECQLNAAAAQDIYELVLSSPATYLQYYIGYLEIIELRDYAKEQLGSKYNIKDFHKAILDVGPAPFSIVRECVKDYVKAAK